MTLIVAAAYDHPIGGLVVAADRRVTYADGSYEDHAEKLIPGSSWVAAHYGAVLVGSDRGRLDVPFAVRSALSDPPAGATPADAAERVADLFSTHGMATVEPSDLAVIVVFGFRDAIPVRYTVSSIEAVSLRTRPVRPTTESACGDTMIVDHINKSLARSAEVQSAGRDRPDCYRTKVEALSLASSSIERGGVLSAAVGGPASMYSIELRNSQAVVSAC